MTKKHYVSLAQALRVQWDEIQSMDGQPRMYATAAFLGAVVIMARELKDENGRFDTEKFMTAVMGA